MFSLLSLSLLKLLNIGVISSNQRAVVFSVGTWTRISPRQFSLPPGVTGQARYDQTLKMHSRVTPVDVTSLAMDMGYRALCSWLDVKSNSEHRSSCCSRSVSVGVVGVSVQFSSVTQSCLTLWDPMNCSMPGFHVLHYLPLFAQTLSQWCHPTISSSVTPFSSCPQSFPASGSFPMSQFFTSDAKVLELQLQQQSFQWIFRVDFL